jgi:superfamily II DNA helicase RecQ
MDGGEETGTRVRQIAGDVLGLADLRPAQMEAAAALAAGRDCLAVLPSGPAPLMGTGSRAGG